MEMQKLCAIEDEKVELSVFIEKEKRFQKDAKKYLVFVVALPLIGAIGLALYGALSYEYGMNTSQTEIFSNSESKPPITNNQIGRDLDLINDCFPNPCMHGNCVVNKTNGYLCSCHTGWKGGVYFDLYV